MGRRGGRNNGFLKDRNLKIGQLEGRYCMWEIEGAELQKFEKVEIFWREWILGIWGKDKPKSQARHILEYSKNQNFLWVLKESKFSQIDFIQIVFNVSTKIRPLHLYRPIGRKRSIFPISGCNPTTLVYARLVERWQFTYEEQVVRIWLFTGLSKISWALTVHPQFMAPLRYTGISSLDYLLILYIY